MGDYFSSRTTKPFAPMKITVYHSKNDPLVVPIIIDGFRRAFDNGLRLKKEVLI